MKPFSITDRNDRENSLKVEAANLDPLWAPEIAKVLRKLLLSETPGGAITALKIPGIVDDFSPISGLGGSLAELRLGLQFISFEPLIGPVGGVNLSKIQWAIVGGESGPNSRPLDIEWVDEIFDQCEAYNVHFFFKQWGGVNKKRTGRTFKGRTWDEMPDIHVHA